MILGFKFGQVMKMSIVKRWGIIDMSRSQSVAEHSYNVAQISRAIVKHIRDIDFGLIDNDQMAQITSWALDHDITEVVTGDIPTPLKAMMNGTFEQNEAKLFPSYIGLKIGLGELVLTVVKIADYVDAIQFMNMYCVEKKGPRFHIMSEMMTKMTESMDNLENLTGVSVHELVDSWLN